MSGKKQGLLGEILQEIQQPHLKAVRRMLPSLNPWLTHEPPPLLISQPASVSLSPPNASNTLTSTQHPRVSVTVPVTVSNIPNAPGALLPPNGMNSNSVQAQNATSTNSDRADATISQTEILPAAPLNMQVPTYTGPTSSEEATPMESVPSIKL